MERDIKKLQCHNSRNDRVIDKLDRSHKASVPTRVQKEGIAGLRTAIHVYRTGENAANYLPDLSAS